METVPTTTSIRIEPKSSLVATSSGLQLRDEQALADFSNDLEAALRDLEKSVKDRKLTAEKVKQLKEDLNGQNWWGTLKSSFTGEADKGLAMMVEDLGSSLGLTQSVLRVILKVQTQKNRMLRDFSDALVNKMFKIQQDTNTLDGNQKAAALNFLEELQTQIDDQIRQQDLVDSHEAALQDHAQWRHGQIQAHADLVNRTEHLQAVALDEQQRVVALENEVDSHEAALQDHAQWRHGQIQAHADLVNRTEHLQAMVLGEQQRVAALEKEVAEIAELRQQVVALASENQRLRSPKSVLLHNLVPLVASLIAFAALFMTMKG